MPSQEVSVTLLFSSECNTLLKMWSRLVGWFGNRFFDRGIGVDICWLVVIGSGKDDSIVKRLFVEFRRC